MLLCLSAEVSQVFCFLLAYRFLRCCNPWVTCQIPLLEITLTLSHCGLLAAAGQSTFWVVCVLELVLLFLALCSWSGWSCGFSLLGCASGKVSVGYLGCEEGGGLGGVVLLQISQEWFKKIKWIMQETPMAWSNFFLKFHWQTSISLLLRSDYYVGKSDECSLCNRTVSFQRSPSEPQCDNKSSHRSSFPLIKKLCTLDTVNSLVRIVKLFVFSLLIPFFDLCLFLLCYSCLLHIWNIFAEAYRIIALYSNVSISS